MKVPVLKQKRLVRRFPVPPRDRSELHPSLFLEENTVHKRYFSKNLIESWNIVKEYRCSD